MFLEEIKKNRLSEPERFLLDKFVGLVKYVSDDYPNRFLYKKDNNDLFEYDPKSQTLRYSYKLIWLAFRDKYMYSYHETNTFVQSMVETNLNLNITTTFAFEGVRYNGENL